jgi:hypothetical protein
VAKPLWRRASENCRAPTRSRVSRKTRFFYRLSLKIKKTRAFSVNNYGFNDNSSKFSKIERSRWPAPKAAPRAAREIRAKSDARAWENRRLSAPHARGSRGWKGNCIVYDFGDF